jgi:hypothetical protein
VCAPVTERFAHCGETRSLRAGAGMNVCAGERPGCPAFAVKRRVRVIYQVKRAVGLHVKCGDVFVSAFKRKADVPGSQALGLTLAERCTGVGGWDGSVAQGLAVRDS